MMFRGSLHRRGELRLFTASEEVPNRDKDHSCQNPADEDLDQAEKVRSPTDEGVTGQERLIFGNSTPAERQA